MQHEQTAVSGDRFAGQVGKCQATAESALPIYGSSTLERNGSSALVGGSG
jgi:hypothetical protein